MTVDLKGSNHPKPAILYAVFFYVRHDRVARRTVKNILRLANQAPSEANMQPWKVYVITGDLMQNLAVAAIDAAQKGLENASDYPTHPNPLPNPYSTRLFEAGIGLCEALGIERADKAGRHTKMLRNTHFFGAPVGLIFTVKKTLVPGQLGDLGMFIQNFMLLAREQGLHSCPQGIWQLVNQTVHRVLDIPDDELIFCDLALGNAVEGHPVNSCQSPRIPVEGLHSSPDSKNNSGPAANSLWLGAHAYMNVTTMIDAN